MTMASLWRLESKIDQVRCHGLQVRAGDLEEVGHVQLTGRSRGCRARSMEQGTLRSKLIKSDRSSCRKEEGPHSPQNEL
jgi:hypothetical protein